ncbi:glucose-6-phosphate dehydrogenase [Opitutaceae bacterium EW11]|nr:glucose-6-phosphate dehydrogenase [Opitutaceae bacterium EW11]
MSSVFNSLPGIEVPVGVVSKSLAQMWEDTAARGGAAPAADDVKATQINLVLHLGFNTTAADAVEQFQTAVRFSRRYPCRVVVLCPLQPDEPETEMRAKIYGECHLGKSKGDTRCCEFVMLSYPVPARRFLESHVSVCLSNDLPMYYWAHRFSSSSKLADYQYLLKRATRVIFDSAIVPEDAFAFPWPRRDTVRDLASARLLPVRQSIGQFLSGYAPQALVDGLAAVRVNSHPSLAAEGRVLVPWVRERLVNCGASQDVRYEALPCTGAADRCFELRFDYRGPKFFSYRGDFVRQHADIEADFGSGRVTLPTAAALLIPEAALGEAMFF